MLDALLRILALTRKELLAVVKDPRSRATLSLPRFNALREHVWATLMDEAKAAELELQT